MEDTQTVHCFCVCSGSALLGDLLGVSRSMERDLLSVLLIYRRIFLRVFIAYLLVEFLYVWLYSAICSCVLVVLVKLSVFAKWLAIERPLWWHLHEVRRLSSQSPGEIACLCVFLFCLVCLCCCVSPGPTQYIFLTPMARYSLYVLKVPLNTKQTNINDENDKYSRSNIDYNMELDLSIISNQKQFSVICGTTFVTSWRLNS